MGCSDSTLRVEFAVVSDLTSNQPLLNGLQDLLETTVGDFTFHGIDDVGHSLVTHSDKPSLIAGGHCYAELVTFSGTSADFDAGLNGLTTLPGGDEKEAQLDGIHSAILSNTIGWLDLSDPLEVHRFVILITDGPYHAAGDAAFTPADLTPDVCATRDYPSTAVLADALKARDARLIVMSPDGMGYDTLKTGLLAEGVASVDLLPLTLGGPFDLTHAMTDHIHCSAPPSTTTGAPTTTGLTTTAPTTTSPTTTAPASTTTTAPTTTSLTTTAPATTTTPTTTAPATLWKKPQCDDIRVEFLHVQDMSHSLTNDMPNLLTLMPAVAGEISSTFSDSHFGLASFVDKPIAPFGFAISLDYCFERHCAIADNTTKFVSSFESLVFHSGFDWKESQLDALHHSVMNRDAMGFSAGVADGTLRVVMVATDSGYHTNADDGMAVGKALMANNNDKVLDCKNEGYVSKANVKAALQASGIMPFFLVTGDVMPKYKELVTELGMGMVSRITADATQLKDDVLDALKTMSGCETPE